MRKAIIVDDIAEYTETLEVYLEDDFEVFKAVDLKNALALAEEQKFDLALIDIRLDEKDSANKDGIKLVSSFRSLFPGMVVIVMSAYHEFDYAVEALNAGADYFMKKPVSPDELSKAISRLLTEGR